MFVFLHLFLCLTYIVYIFTATHCNTRQSPATHCNILHHTATHGNALQHTHIDRSLITCSVFLHTFLVTASAVFCTNSRNATHCNNLQHPATPLSHGNTLQHPATPCSTLQHTVTHCNTLTYLHWTTVLSSARTHATGRERWYRPSPPQSPPSLTLHIYMYLFRLCHLLRGENNRLILIAELTNSEQSNLYQDCSVMTRYAGTLKAYVAARTHI